MIEYNDIFLLEKQPDIIDAKVRYRVRWGKEQVAFSLGYRIEPSKWVSESQFCKNNTTHGKKKIPASLINRRIYKYREATESIFKTAYQKGNEIRKDEFKRQFSIAIGRESNESSDSKHFFETFDAFIKQESISKSWTQNTLIKFSTIRRHLEEFDPNISFANLSNQYMTSLLDFFLTNRSMSNTTVKKDLNLIMWFIRWASREGIYDGTIHHTFKPRLKGQNGGINDVIHLTWDELIRLYNFKFDTERLSNVRDVFCFCCFTSLRYCDVSRLTKVDVFQDHIRLVSKKDVEGLKIELNKYSKSIIDRYRNVDLPNKLALPIISNQKMNDALKIIAKAIKMKDPVKVVTFTGNVRSEKVYQKWELITTHCGRRTFIVNALFLGIPAEVVMKWTGHADYKAMKPYIKIVDQLKASEMDKFNR